MTTAWTPIILGPTPPHAEEPSSSAAEPEFLRGTGLNLTNLVAPTPNPVTNFINTKQQVISILINLVTSQRV
ncbi:hypothetical protein [Streptomyces sp. RPT161]|uniref:hypothetical protein n=1 Tax=Streptomyces sp. RPT161 TaxID=3015993 RepID=UPI0022B8F942|nr:hypothetical protein [Streptomyces sp. RPT161]